MQQNNRENFSQHTKLLHLALYSKKHKIAGQAAARFEKVADTFPQMLIFRMRGQLDHALADRELHLRVRKRKNNHFNMKKKSSHDIVAKSGCSLETARVPLHQRFHGLPRFINTEREHVTDRAAKQKHLGICERIHRAMRQCCRHWVVLKWLRPYRVPCLPINVE
jgi:hypothetical protein